MADREVLLAKNRGYRMRAAIIAFVLVLLTVGGMWYTHRGGSPPPPSEFNWEERQADAESKGYNLITTGTLAGYFEAGTRNLRIVDTRQEWEYRTAHIDGALLFPAEPTRWWRWKNAGALEALLGPDKEATVVFYCSGPA